MFVSLFVFVAFTFMYAQSRGVLADDSSLVARPPGR